MRITKTGIVLVAIYLLGLIASAIWAQFIIDPKSQGVILQLPVAIQHALLLSVNATHLLHGMSWTAIYIVLGVPMLIMLMLLGYVIERLASILGLSWD